LATGYLQINEDPLVLRPMITHGLPLSVKSSLRDIFKIVKINLYT